MRSRFHIHLARAFDAFCLIGAALCIGTLIGMNLAVWAAS
jgi:hypothetical protein